MRHPLRDGRGGRAARWTTALALALASAGAVGPAAATADAASLLIVPGRSIGGISLGMTRAQVQRIAGLCTVPGCISYTGSLRVQRGRGFYSQISVAFLGRALTSRAVMVSVGNNSSFRLPSGLRPIGATARTLKDALGATCYFWNPTSNVPDPNADGTEPQHCVLISPGPRYTSFKVNGSHPLVAGNDGKATQVLISTRPIPNF
jgi:hypothetical protein